MIKKFSEEYLHFFKFFIDEKNSLENQLKKKVLFKTIFNL